MEEGRWGSALRHWRPDHSSWRGRHHPWRWRAPQAWRGNHHSWRRRTAHSRWWWHSHEAGRRHPAWWGHSERRRRVVHVRRHSGRYSHHFRSTLLRTRIRNLIVLNIELWIVDVNPHLQKLLLQLLPLLAHLHVQTLLDNLSCHTLHSINVCLNELSTCFGIRNPTIKSRIG